MVTLPRDLRLAVRTLLRKPGVTALALASLGLAIGFSTAAFSILDAYALRDLPVRDPNRLVRIDVSTRENREDSMSWPEYQALTRVPALAGVAVEDREGQRVRLPGRDDFPIIGYVSDNYFDLLGVKTEMGDLFHGGKGEDQTVVITQRYWKEKLGADPAVIGSNLPVGPTVLRIVAVLPPEFTGTRRGLVVDLFVPAQTVFGSLRAGSPDDARYTAYEVIGRLRPGATREQARIEGDSALRQLEAEGRAPAPERRMAVYEFGEGALRQKLESNAAMLAMIVILVLIAAANLANLRLVDNESRRHETAVRLALGAGHSDLARIHITETLLLSAAATALGLVIARWLIGLAPALLYGGRSFIDFHIRLDARAFAFSSAALLAVALLGAAIALIEASRRGVPALHGSRTTRPSRWLTALVITQMAVVTAVACSAGLLWRTVGKLSEIRPAMDPGRKLLLVNGSFDMKAAAALPRIETLAKGLARLPGVAHVAWARRVMLSGSGGGATVDVAIPGQPVRPVPYNSVSPGYFAATGARILNGRAFSAADTAPATPVVMVNSLFTRRYLQGADPLGSWINIAGIDRQVVGIVEDGPHNHLREELQPYLYFAFAQKPPAYSTWIIESSGNPGRLAGSVRAYLRGADSSYTLYSMRTLSEHLREARREQQLAAEVSGALACVGLLLAAAGLFGVTLFAVTRRTPEFGVRVAMGASPARLVRQVLREAGARVALAFPLGWLLTYAGRRAIGKMLYGVAPDDPWTFALATGIVAAVALAAALQPAIRVSRIDPMTALRHD